MRPLRKLKAYGINLFGKGGMGEYERECFFALSDVRMFRGNHGSIRVAVGNVDEISEVLEPLECDYRGKKINLSARQYVSDMVAYLSNSPGERYVAFNSANGDLIHPNMKPINPEDVPKDVASIWNLNTVFELSPENGIKTYKRGESISPPNVSVLNLRPDIKMYETPAATL